MAYATSKGKPSLAPFMDISTIFHGTDRPVSMTPTLDMLATGAVVRISLSIAFGIVFALLVGAFAPLLRNRLVLGGAGIVSGLGLYVVNFQILGNTLFQWFTNPQGPDQGFEVFIHAAFGADARPVLARARTSSTDVGRTEGLTVLARTARHRAPSSRKRLARGDERHSAVAPVFEV